MNKKDDIWTGSALYGSNHLRSHGGVTFLWCSFDGSEMIRR